MVKRRIAEFGGQDGYSASLMQRITSGDLKQYTDSWISGHAYNEFNGNGKSLAVIDWATDSNGLNCEGIYNPNQINRKWCGSRTMTTLPKTFQRTTTKMWRPLLTCSWQRPDTAWQIC